MSRITVSEKEHWKQRIESRITKAIDALEASDSSFAASLEHQAETQTHESLGTYGMQLKLRSVREQIETLEAEASQLKKLMHETPLQPGDFQGKGEWAIENAYKRLFEKRKRIIEDAILSDTETGRAILKLRAEKEALLDTVWLATSSKQIQELWSKVSQVVGDRATELQEKLLAESSPD